MTYLEYCGGQAKCFDKFLMYGGSYWDKLIEASANAIVEISIGSNEGVLRTLGDVQNTIEGIAYTSNFQIPSDCATSAIPDPILYMGLVISDAVKMHLGDVDKDEFYNKLGVLHCVIGRFLDVLEVDKTEYNTARLELLMSQVNI